jgi:hypothetical protein
VIDFSDTVIMSQKFKFIGVFLVLVSGCAYNREFFNDCRPAVPAMRDYAIQHLPDLSQEDRRVITTTEPRLAHANYVEVHFTWTNICEVLSSAPPCQPFKVVDLRKQS